MGIKQFIFLAILIISLSSVFPDGNDEPQRDEIMLQIDNDIVIIDVEYFPNSEIVSQFIGRLNSDSNNRYVIQFKDSEVIDLYGDIILSFIDYSPSFYGFKIIPYYPNNGYPPGLSLVPYFDSGDSVGDNINISWNYDDETFQEVILDIP